MRSWTLDKLIEHGRFCVVCRFVLVTCVNYCAKDCFSFANISIKVQELLLQFVGIGESFVAAQNVDSFLPCAIAVQCEMIALCKYVVDAIVVIISEICGAFCTL